MNVRELHDACERVLKSGAGAGEWPVFVSLKGEDAHSNPEADDLFYHELSDVDGSSDSERTEEPMLLYAGQIISC